MNGLEIVFLILGSIIGGIGVTTILVSRHLRKVKSIGELYERVERVLESGNRMAVTGATMLGFWAILIILEHLLA